MYIKRDALRAVASLFSPEESRDDADEGESHGHARAHDERRAHLHAHALDRARRRPVVRQALGARSRRAHRGRFSRSNVPIVDALRLVVDDWTPRGRRLWRARSALDEILSRGRVRETGARDVARDARARRRGRRAATRASDGATHRDVTRRETTAARRGRGDAFGWSDSNYNVRSSFFSTPGPVCSPTRLASGRWSSRATPWSFR